MFNNKNDRTWDLVTRVPRRSGDIMMREHLIALAIVIGKVLAYPRQHFSLRCTGNRPSEHLIVNRSIVFHLGIINAMVFGARVSISSYK